MTPDIIVIGGGIAGVSAAAELSVSADVLLLEGEAALAYHASGRSAAMFLPFYGNRVVRALNEASADHHMNADGGVLRQRQFMAVAGADRAGAMAAAVDDLGLRVMDMDAAVAAFPILNPRTIAHAATTDGAWDLDTDLLIQNYRRQLLGNGGQIALRARVTGIARDSGLWRVTWDGGEATAAHIVNAAGAWADTLAALAGVTPLGLVPHRRSMAQLAAPEGRDVTHWPFVEDIDEAWYARPDAGRWIVSAAEEDPMEPMDAWADDMVLAEGLARYQNAVTAEVTRPLTTWAGLRTIAPDRALVIGADSRAPGFWWCAGQLGYGFQTAPAVSRLLRDLMQGASPELVGGTVAALSPGRFT